MIEVNSKSFDKEVLNEKVKVLVDFNASWCAPCRMLRPILEDLAKESDSYKIVSVNIDDEEELASKYGVYSIPCLILFKEGNEVLRSVGFKPKDEIKKILGGK